MSHTAVRCRNSAAESHCSSKPSLASNPGSARPGGTTRGVATSESLDTMRAGRR